MSDDEFLGRKIGISSDRELDNLHCIPSLESSHTSRYMDNFQSLKPGMSYPPHRNYSDSFGSPHRTWTADEEVEKAQIRSEDELTPVKKLRHRDTTELEEIAGSSTISYPLSKSSRKSSKKGGKSEVTDSTGTYTIQGITNKSFSDFGPAADTASVKSNGTYTLNEEQQQSLEEMRKSKKGPVGFSKKRTKRRSTVKF